MKDAPFVARPWYEQAMRYLPLVVALALAAAPGRARAAPPEAASRPGAAALALDVKRTKLASGLRVVTLVDRTSPTVAIELLFDVGARHEERGRTGFAHLFEHMMFQGSKNVARGQHLALVSGHGGATDAQTHSDYTRYYDLLPSNELALGLWLEADRMKSLDVSQANLDNQRAVVKEEYRMRVENAAYGPARIRLAELAYQGYWPYEHAGIGTMRDLDAAELSWVREFHARHYRPNNAVLAIAGDFDEAECLALVKRYFGDAAPGPAPRLVLPPVPEQTAPRSAVVEDAHAKLPALYSAWVIPPSGDPDHYALELAGLVLSDGETSRLSSILVRGRSLAVEARSYVRGHHGPDLFALDVRLASGAKPADVQKVVDAEIADLAKNGPTQAEMKKARARIEARVLRYLQSNGARAEELAALELFRGDATLINTEVGRYLAVTADDVKRVVGKYLVASRRSDVEVKPAAAATGAAEKAERKERR